jgi:hypothetical protein
MSGAGRADRKGNECQTSRTHALAAESLTLMNAPRRHQAWSFGRWFGINM